MIENVTISINKNISNHAGRENGRIVIVITTDNMDKTKKLYDILDLILRESSNYYTWASGRELNGYEFEKPLSRNQYENTTRLFFLDLDVNLSNSALLRLIDTVKYMYLGRE